MFWFVCGDVGKVIIVASDAQQAQQARSLFELFEDSAPLSEDETRQLTGDFSTLSEYTSPPP